MRLEATGESGWRTVSPTASPVAIKRAKPQLWLFDAFSEPLGGPRVASLCQKLFSESSIILIILKLEFINYLIIKLVDM